MIIQPMKVNISLIFSWKSVSDDSYEPKENRKCKVEEHLRFAFMRICSDGLYIIFWSKS